MHTPCINQNHSKEYIVHSKWVIEEFDKGTISNIDRI